MDTSKVGEGVRITALGGLLVLGPLYASASPLLTKIGCDVEEIEVSDNGSLAEFAAQHSRENAGTVIVVPSSEVKEETSDEVRLCSLAQNLSDNVTILRYVAPSHTAQVLMLFVEGDKLSEIDARHSEDRFEGADRVTFTLLDMARGGSD